MVSMVIVPLTRITAYRNVRRNWREIAEASSSIWSKFPPSGPLTPTTVGVGVAFAVRNGGLRYCVPAAAEAM
jgi:hypothetical protein